jgi:hypothetical protein
MSALVRATGLQSLLFGAVDLNDDAILYDDRHGSVLQVAK